MLYYNVSIRTYIKLFKNVFCILQTNEINLDHRILNVINCTIQIYIITLLNKISLLAIKKQFENFVADPGAL